MGLMPFLLHMNAFLTGECHFSFTFLFLTFLVYLWDNICNTGEYCCRCLCSASFFVRRPFLALCHCQLHPTCCHWQQGDPAPTALSHQH